MAALESLAGRRVALIVGGFDRGIDYGPLATALAGRSASTLVLTLPDNGPRIHAALTAHGAPEPPVVDCPTLDEATARAFDWARPDGVVLLSPAAPSFGGFRDYRHRATAFEEAMRRCAGDLARSEGHPG
jgi:UDP-N-acetylmuramoyl-L-alanine---L-glutamate ligase